MQEDLLSLDSLKHSLKYCSIISSVDFLPSTVCSYLCNLDVSKACGPDVIPAFLLQSNVEVITSPLSYLFKSMNTGTLPRDWVCAIVIPIFKHDNKHIPSHYWPISLTTTLLLSRLWNA